MIILDTHVWVWWVDGSPSLTAAQRKHVEDHEAAVQTLTNQGFTLFTENDLNE